MRELSGVLLMFTPAVWSPYEPNFTDLVAERCSTLKLPICKKVKKEMGMRLRSQLSYKSNLESNTLV